MAWTTDIFKPMDGSDKRKELGLHADDFVIGFYGSVERLYAIDEMIKDLPELIQYHPSTKMLVVGGSLFTNYEAELKKLVEDLKVSDHVIFTGTKPYAGLPEYIACMDICTILLSPPVGRYCTPKQIL